MKDKGEPHIINSSLLNFFPKYYFNETTFIKEVNSTQTSSNKKPKTKTLQKSLVTIKKIICSFCPLISSGSIMFRMPGHIE